MDNLNYWKDKWIEAGKSYILNQKTRNEVINIWNESSQNYDNTVDNIRMEILTKLEDEFINENSVVLDLGCGTGAYSLYLSDICKEVHALDYSEGMINVLKNKIEKNSINNIKIINKDWNEIDLKSENMYKKYDFIICSLNPGCYNPESLLKINDASKYGCCYIGTNGKEENQIFKNADEYIIGQEIDKCDISNIIYPFNILYFSDYNPSLFYTTCKWDMEYNLENAISKLNDRYKNHADSIENIQDKIEEFASNNMVEDKFSYESKNTLGVITWKV